MRVVISKILFILMYFPSAINAQGGSNYSIFGIGDIHHSIGAYYDGIGGTAIAVPTELAINYKNPALWSFNKFTALQGGYKFNQHYNRNELNELWQNNGKVIGIFGLFAIDTSFGIAGSFGIAPYSSVNYLVSSPVFVNIEELELKGFTTYQGLGGINSIYLGGATKIFENLSIGANIYTLFGKTAFVNKTSFLQFDYLSSANLTNDSYRGWGFKTGLFYRILEQFGAGLYYEGNSKIDITREMLISMQGIGDTLMDCKLNFEIPDKLGVGISYQTQKYLFAADLVLQNFENLKYQKQDKSSFGENRLISIGFIRYGNTNYYADYFDKVTYKLGLSYQDLFYSIDNIKIKEFAGSFGFSFPMPGIAYIETAITLGKRGAQGDNLINELFGRLSVDVIIGETWFKPFRREFER